MENTLTAFQIDARDNVATALSEIPAGAVVQIHGTGAPILVTAAENIPVGHKIALRDIAEGQNIVKYGVVIGRSTANIPKGAWVHLHVMRSVYDERSSHLDVLTGAPKDTKYE